MVIEGQVRISLTNEDGKEVGLNLIGAGRLVGLCSMLDRGTQPATVSTACESHLVEEVVGHIGLAIGDYHFYHFSHRLPLLIATDCT